MGNRISILNLGGERHKITDDCVRSYIYGDQAVARCAPPQIEPCNRKLKQKATADFILILE